MEPINQTNLQQPTRLSESPDFIPFRRGDVMTDETRAQLHTALNWQPLISTLTQLSQPVKVEAAS